MPVRTSRIPNVFFRKSVLICLERNDAMKAKIHPHKIAGEIFLSWIVFCFVRKRVAIIAAGRKNKRLIVLAIS